MIWLLWKLSTLPIRLVLGAISGTFKTVRFVGVSRILAFGAGVGVGMSISPSTSEQFRARLAGAHAAASSAAGDLGETVRYELAHSPRTWHLPQPVVSVEGNRITLTGEVPHETARGDLGRTAGAVVGVAAVDNRLTISRASGDS